MRILITGDPESDKVGRLIKMAEDLGHTIVMSAVVGGGLAIQEIHAGMDTPTGKLIKFVQAEAATDRERIPMTKKKGRRRMNRKERRQQDARKGRRKP